MKYQIQEPAKELEGSRILYQKLANGGDSVRPKEQEKTLVKWDMPDLTEVTEY